MNEVNVWYLVLLSLSTVSLIGSSGFWPRLPCATPVAWLRPCALAANQLVWEGLILKVSRVRLLNASLAHSRSSLTLLVLVTLSHTQWCVQNSPLLVSFRCFEILDVSLYMYIPFTQTVPSVFTISVRYKRVEFYILLAHSWVWKVFRLVSSCQCIYTFVKTSESSSIVWAPYNMKKSREKTWQK